MKRISILAILSLSLGCTSRRPIEKVVLSEKIVSDTIHIANKALDYEIIIIDPGFTGWLNTFAKPRGYYSQQYLEARNREWVIAWNTRAANPAVYGNLFLFTIDYANHIDYGYEVNYLLYYYLTYFQLVNQVKLGSFMPRI